MYHNIFSLKRPALHLNYSSNPTDVISRPTKLTLGWMYGKRKMLGLPFVTSQSSKLQEECVNGTHSLKKVEQAKGF